MQKRGFRIALDLMLLSAIVLGGMRLHALRSERGRLQREANELAGIVGRLDISDPDAIHYVRIPAEQPGRWRFRVYLPPDVQVRWLVGETRFDKSMQKVDGGGSSSSRSGRVNEEPQEFIIEAGFITHPHGAQSFGFSQPGGSSRMSFSNWSSVDLNDPQSIRVGGPEIGDQQTVDSDGRLTLLRIASGKPLSRKPEQDKKGDVFPGFAIEIDVTGLDPPPQFVQETP